MKLVGSKKAVRTAAFHKRQELKRKFVVGLYGVFLLLLVISPIFALRNDKQFVSKINVSEVPEAEGIKKIVEDNLEGSYLGILPKQSVFLVSEEQISKQVLKSFPRFLSANVSSSGLNELVVEVRERKPFAIYCGDKCYFMDEEGMIFAEAPAFTPGVFSVFGSEAEIVDPIGTIYMNKDDLGKLDKFQKNLPRLNLTPKILIKNDYKYKVQLSEGPSILWKIEQDVDGIFSNLSTLLSSRTIKYSELSTLDHIDFSLGSKVYWK